MVVTTTRIRHNDHNNSDNSNNTKPSNNKNSSDDGHNTDTNRRVVGIVITMTAKLYGKEPS